MAVQLFQLNKECLFNPAECVDAILGEDEDIPEEEGETGNDQQSEWNIKGVGGLSFDTFA